MSEYLVRWKFGPNSLLNDRDTETTWFKQFHPNKEQAVSHYVSLLQNTMPSMKVTVEIFELKQLIPGQDSEEVVEEETRDEMIIRLFNDGKTRTEISDETGVGYSTVCRVINAY